MRTDASPIVFRVSDEERFLLEAGAAWVGSKNLSSYIRDTMIDITRRLLDSDDGLAHVERRKKLNESGRRGEVAYLDQVLAQGAPEPRHGSYTVEAPGRVDGDAKDPTG